MAAAGPRDPFAAPSRARPDAAPTRSIVRRPSHRDRAVDRPAVASRLRARSPLGAEVIWRIHRAGDAATDVDRGAVPTAVVSLGTLPVGLAGRKSGQAPHQPQGRGGEWM